MEIAAEYKLYTCKNPKGVVMFLHGAMEYEARYLDFFNFLNENNYIVATYNQPGHGDENSKIHDIDDPKELEFKALGLKREIENLYPNLDHHIIGHSMGSLITRNVINHREYNFDKVILLGTPNPSDATIDFGLTLINLHIKLQGKSHASKLANYLCFGSFATKMRLKYRTRNWLNSDRNQFGKYKADPLCGNLFSNNYIYALLLQSKRAVQSVSIANLKAHEYLVLNGTHDPVNRFGKDLSRFSALHSINYQKMRHELLFEVNNIHVYTDILNFLNK